MSSLIYKIFKPITTEKIKNNKLIETIDNIKKEIIDKQKLFKDKSIEKKLI